MLQLHEVLRSGEVRHREFSHQTWIDSIADTSVRTRWGHRPDDCHDPVERAWAEWRGADVTQIVERIRELESPIPAPPPPKLSRPSQGSFDFEG